MSYIKSNKLTIDKSIELAHKYQDYNSFVTIIDNASNDKNGILSNVPYSLKDNVSTTGVLTTGSSNILKDYVPVFDATIYERLANAGGVLIGKVTLDELAMGGTGTLAHTGVVKNPWNKERISGGSSSGSVASVALGITPFSIGSDTGDSIREPAAMCGVVGFKPTYGLISRYGVFPFASSMDHVGVVTRSVADVAIVLDAVKGIDPMDMTSYECDTEFYSGLDTNIDAKLFTIKEVNEALKTNSDVYDSYMKTIDKMKELGFIIDEVSINEDLLVAVYPAYFAIACAEATSNNANLTGLIFGSRKEGSSVEEIMFNTRTEGFSEDIKKRFVLGSYVLQKENQEKLFINAKRVRRMIVQEFNELFKEYDGYILPGSPDIAPLINEVNTGIRENIDVLSQVHAIANFGGYPSITLPTDMVRDMPVGINITGAVKDDLKVLNIAKIIEKAVEFKYLEEGDLDV